MPANKSILDGNAAVADVAYRLSEVVSIFPITPSSAMGEWADQWSGEGRANLWGDVPLVCEMQSEGGAAGAAHGALQAGALATTFTASQGLLLMIPNMYKIAGELTSAVFHVAARSVAAHALSIFGDHGDVMAARQTGWAMLCSHDVQEAADMAAIAHAATLEARVPFVHFFDGFRTSHEIADISLPDDAVLRALLGPDAGRAHRERALTPDRPVLRGTAQNPDVFFQSREAANPYYDAAPDVVRRAMARYAKLTGRDYGLYDYHGAPDAERVVVVMGSAAQTVAATVDALNARGEKVGVVKVRLYRPFDAAAFAKAFPAATKAVAVLDRTKEPGSVGEPLFLDALGALERALSAGTAPFASLPRLIGGRYGLSSKEFTPAMAKAVFDELAAPKPRARFSVGIRDDVTGLSLDHDPSFSAENGDAFRAVFFGLGSDGTVGANKNSIHIIGEGADQHVQAYFVYDSKKSGAMTVSHLRFGPKPIRAPYLIERADFLACHQDSFLGRFKMLELLAPGGVFLLNTSVPAESVWASLPRADQELIRAKKLRVFVIDAYALAREQKLGGRINTVMQTCFFAISGVIARDKALAAVRDSIRRSYGKKSEEIVLRNLAAVDATLSRLREIKIAGEINGAAAAPSGFDAHAPEFVSRVLGRIYAGDGDALPVSALPADGTFPTGTARYEKRALAQDVPVWDPACCIQCGKCALVCPHAAIRQKAVPEELLAGAPADLPSAPAKDLEWKGHRYLLQVSPDDCTGCGLCVDACPARNKSETGLKAINMTPIAAVRERERRRWARFVELPETERARIKPSAIRSQQFQQPLFEFSGACAGCGETPYLKLLSQLFGDRLLVANATGCSSIYGGNLPTTPWAKNPEGRGPAWSNSLFEDNAEFGLGLRLALDHAELSARGLLEALADRLDADLAREILGARQDDEAGVREQRARLERLKPALAALDDPRARRLESNLSALSRKSVWIVGGDGWAYDIGYGGLDHVLASGRNVKVLVLDTEVYSNTGGQKSKATPRGAVAKFSNAGNPSAKKDLGLMAMSYGGVYVASVAMGARDEHTLRAFLEAESYDGPALIIAYSHCIAHGIDMGLGLRAQKSAVDTGRWLLYRYDPRRAAAGEPALALDSKAPQSAAFAARLADEGRFQMLARAHPARAKELFARAAEDARARRALFEYLSARPSGPKEG